MSPTELRRTLESIVVRNSRLKLTGVEDGQRLAVDLGFDSLAFLLAVGDLESELAITFPLDRIDDLREMTFRDLIGIVSAERNRLAAEA
jgi:acyl carrier protein